MQTTLRNTVREVTAYRPLSAPISQLNNLSLPSFLHLPPEHHPQYKRRCHINVNDFPPLFNAQVEERRRIENCRTVHQDINGPRIMKGVLRESLSCPWRRQVCGDDTYSPTHGLYFCNEISRCRGMHMQNE